MGDRCSLTFQFRTRDKEIFDKAAEKCYGNDTLESLVDSVQDAQNVGRILQDDEGVVPNTDESCTLEASTSEADYGYEDMLQEAAEKGAVFIGDSGAGNGYGPMIFCAIAGKFFQVKVDVDTGTPLVSVDLNTGKVNEDEFKKVREFKNAALTANILLGTDFLNLDS